MLPYIKIRRNYSMRSPLTLRRNPSWKQISCATNFTDQLLRNANPELWSDAKKGLNNSLISNKLTVANVSKFFDGSQLQINIGKINTLMMDEGTSWLYIINCFLQHYSRIPVCVQQYLHAKVSIQSLHRIDLVLDSNLLDARRLAILFWTLTLLDNRTLPIQIKDLELAVVF